MFHGIIVQVLDPVLEVIRGSSRTRKWCVGADLDPDVSVFVVIPFVGDSAFLQAEAYELTDRGGTDSDVAQILDVKLTEDKIEIPASTALPVGLHVVKDIAEHLSAGVYATCC